MTFLDPKISGKSLEPLSFQDSTLRKARDNTEVFNILSLNIFGEYRQVLQLYVPLIYSGNVNLINFYEENTLG